MAIIVGSGDFKYRIVEDWAKLPDGWSFKEVGAVGVDAKDNVYVFNRGEHPVMVFDRAGNFLRSWGEGQYPRAHGVHMGPDDSIYLTDDGGHFVRKCSLDGKVLLELGIPGKPSGPRAVTETGRAVRSSVELATDELALPAWAALGEEGCERLLELARPLARLVTAAGDVPFPNPMGVPQS